MNDDLHHHDTHTRSDHGNRRNRRDGRPTPTPKSKIENPKSKIEPPHPLGPEFLETHRALGRHRHALDALLLCAITDAAGAIAEAAAGNSPFHNEIEFRAASRLLDLLPLLQHPDDVEAAALRRLDERKERQRKHESEREAEREADESNAQP